MHDSAFANTMEEVTHLRHAGLVKFILWVLYSIFSSLGNSVLNVIGIEEQNTTGQRISLCSSESGRYPYTAPQISNTQGMCHQSSWEATKPSLPYSYASVLQT